MLIKEIEAPVGCLFSHKGSACSQAFNDASRGLEAKYQLAQAAREKTRANIDAKIRAMDIIKRDLEVAELEMDNTKAEQASLRQNMPCCCMLFSRESHGGRQRVMCTMRGHLLMCMESE